MNATTLQSDAQAVDSKISALMTGTDTDVRQEVVPSSDGNNAFIIRLLGVKHSDLTGVNLSSLTGGLAIVNLVPMKSMFASRPSDSDTDKSYKPAYVTNPAEILETQAGAGKQILDVINGDPFLGAYQGLLAAPDSGKMDDACKGLTQTLSNTLRLTPDDELVARWAVLKMKTRYDNADFAMRTDSCWSSSDAQRAAALDNVYVFSQVRDDPSKSIAPELNNLDITLLNALTSLSDGSFGGLQSLADPTSFQVIVWGSALSPPAGKKWSDLTGTAALSEFAKLGPFGAGCWQAPKPPGDLTKSAIMLRPLSGSASIPVAVVRDSNQKIVRLIFGDSFSISSYVNTPPTWPQSCG